jgi:hypothetical protein
MTRPSTGAPWPKFSWGTEALTARLDRLAAYVTTENAAALRWYIAETDRVRLLRWPDLLLVLLAAVIALFAGLGPDRGGQRLSPG